jgi:hypothetical protein
MMIITYNGVRYEITNWKEFEEKLLNAIGFSLTNEVRKEIDRMKLVQSGHLRQSIVHTVDNGELILTSLAPYAVYLEYGTYDYWKIYGATSFPRKGYPHIPKKKELTPEQKKGLPKGMQPFAMFRRVLYNPNVMAKVIDRAMRAL